MRAHPWPQLAAVNTREKNQNEGKIVVIKENGYCGLKSEDESIPIREFNFDYTYDDDSIQPDVYQNLGAPLLHKAFGGWNGTIFAYGQTGAGKSFSMTGSATMPGIIPLMNAEMFERIADSTAQNPNKLFLVTCSFLEICAIFGPAHAQRGCTKCLPHGSAHTTCGCGPETRALLQLSRASACTRGRGRRQRGALRSSRPDGHARHC